MPVIETGTGNCHVFVDASADLGPGARDHAERQDPAGRACATRPRRCSSTRTPPRRSCRWCCPRSPTPGSRLHADERTRGRGRRPRHRRACRRPTSDWADEYLVARPRRRRRRLPRRRDRAHPALVQRPHRGHLHRATCGPPTGSPRRSTRRWSRSTPRRRSPTAASSGSGPRSGSPPRSCTPAGPMGLAELTSTKWVVTGDGHVRP